MKHSIRVKLVLIIMALMAGLILFICAFNVLFLNKYYMRMKEEALYETFVAIQDIIDNDATESEIADTLRNINNEHNISVLIVDSSLMPVYTIQADINNMLNWLKDNLLNPNTPRKIISQGDNYIIQQGYNKYEKQDFLALIGFSEDSMYNIIMQLPVQSINENVEISNRFFIMAGFVAIIIGGIVAFFVSKRFTDPIKRLSYTAEAVAEMNFDVKYDTKDESEIGHLGNSINKMSENLKKYISDLKMANLELEKDIKRKEEIDNMRKDFVSNVSHELKTPIALIQGYAEGLKDGISDDPESMEYYCEVIIDEAAKMNSMVKQLLNLNHLESGNEPLSLERFDIIKLLSSIIRANSLRAEQKGAKIQFVEREPVYVWADQFKIEEVITNYLSNAINHVESYNNTEPYINITVNKNQDKIRVSVFNTGKNIPEEDINKIWDKFYKVDKARTREYGGSGVGLSIVKAIMSSHNQSIGVKNFKEGVEFWFELDCENR